MKASPRALRWILLHAAFAASLFAQTPPAKIAFPQPSPFAVIEQRVGVTNFKIEYSRPSMKGRRIFGGLEPWGEVWRTGANNPTKISFDTPVKFGGQEVPAGTYGLYSLLGRDEWTVILNRIGTRDWGAYSYNPDNDIARVKVRPVALAQPFETFTIDFGDLRVGSATLNLSWENTRVPVPIEVDTMGILKPQIEAAMASDAARKPYYDAAMFYYEAGGDLQQALAWMNRALEQNPKSFPMIYRKGLILEKMGDKAGAIAAAEASRAQAEKASPAALRDEYVRLNDALIARAK